jgi:hypothetical protein
MNLLLTMQPSPEFTVAPARGLPFVSKKLKIGPSLGNENGSRKSALAEACPSRTPNAEGPALTDALVAKMNSAKTGPPTTPDSRGVCAFTSDIPAEKMPEAVDSPPFVSP